MHQDSQVLYLLMSCSLLVILFPKLTRSQCSPINTEWGSYELSERPRDFEGVPTTGACTTNEGTRCLGPGFRALGGLGRLGDGEHGTQTLNVSAVQAWNQTVSMTLSSFSSPIVGINLYFYNVPSRGIGLPYDIIINSADLQFALEGNQDFSQDDNQLRNVTLILQSLSRTSVMVTFTFSERDHIDWLLLTEIEVCTSSIAVTLPDPPPPITFTEDTVSSVSPSTINSSITLTCSVTEGRFDWSWTGPPGISLPLSIVLNVGRTSVLELSQLSAGHSGTYRCVATHRYGQEPRASASFDISLSLMHGTIQEDSPTVRVTSSDSTATLRCMLYGYLPSGEEPSIKWELDGATLSNNSMYTITTEDGKMLIQNGGLQPIPSLTSTLTVNLTLSPLTVSQPYICLSDQAAGFQIITIMRDTVAPPPATTSSFSSTTAPPTPSSDDNLGLILGVVISAIVVLVTIIIIVIITLMCIVRRRSQRSMDYPNQYEELSKPDPPPLPAQFPSFPVSDIRPYASVDVTGARQVHNSDIELSGNAAYGLKPDCTGFIEERQNGERQVDIELSGNAACGLKPEHTGERENEVRQVSTEIHLNENAAYESKPTNFVGVMQSELHELQDTLRAAHSEDPDPMIPQYQEHVFGASNLAVEWQVVESENTPAQFSHDIGMNENMVYGHDHLTNGTCTVDSDTTVCDQSASAANHLPSQLRNEVIPFSDQQPTTQQQAVTDEYLTVLP